MIRNIAIDYSKLIFSFLVIAIHCQTVTGSPLIDWGIQNGIARISVPFFFLVNGFYLPPSGKHCAHYFKRLFSIYVVWSIIYLPFWSADLKWQVIFSIMGYHHLWYLSALIFASLVLFILEKYQTPHRFLFLGSFVLFFTGFVLAQTGINIYKYRNFIFMGFPFICLGHLIRYHSHRFISLNNKTLFSLCTIFLISLLSESFLTYNGILRSSDMHLSLILLCPTLFILIQRNGTMIRADGYFSHIASLVFFIHILVITMIDHWFDFHHPPYLLIVFISLLFASGLFELNKRIRIFL